MPVNASLYKDLVRRYGLKKGKAVYYAMESDGKPTFRKALRTAVKEGHIFGLRRKKNG